MMLRCLTSLVNTYILGDFLSELLSLTFKDVTWRNHRVSICCWQTPQWFLRTWDWWYSWMLFTPAETNLFFLPCCIKSENTIIELSSIMKCSGENSSTYSDTYCNSILYCPLHDSLYCVPLSQPLWWQAEISTPSRDIMSHSWSIMVIQTLLSACYSTATPAFQLSVSWLTQTAFIHCSPNRC